MLNNLQENQYKNDEDEESEVEQDVTTIENINDTIIEQPSNLQSVLPTSDEIGQVAKDFSFADLRKACKEKGISAKGSKEQLIERLMKPTFLV